MLIRFSVENHKSFSDRAELSMVPGKSRAHDHHIHQLPEKGNPGLLKAGVIYGANASGKTNLVHAIEQAKMMVVNGTPNKRISYSPNRLSTQYHQQPTRFEFEIQSHSKQYAYGFIFTDQNIIEEWLFDISEKKERPVFERKLEGERSQFSWGDIEFKNPEDEQFLAFTAKGTPENRLFLHECKERNVLQDAPYLVDFSNVFMWFKSTLQVLFPKSTSSKLIRDIQSKDNTGSPYHRLLRNFDTGISKLGFEKLAFPEGEILPDLFEQLSQELSDEVVLEIRSQGNIYALKRNAEGEPELSHLVTQHKNDQGEDIPFKLTEESDGTQRLLDLAPALYDLFTTECVYVIDEFNRSLHPDITYSILSAFLGEKAAHQSQLIFTTHQTTLLDQNLVRRDEVWFAEKDNNGSSKLYSLEEFKPRKDKDFRRSYLDGRYGGVPILPNITNLNWLCDDA